MIKRGDYLVLLLALVLLPTLYLTLWNDQRPGEYARILVGGEQLQMVSLHQPQTLEVMGELGLSTLEVADGQIRFVESACPGKQCVHSGWIHWGGEVVSCLPNRVSVAILGGEQRFDSINF
jgi:hypothetical protein